MTEEIISVLVIEDEPHIRGIIEYNLKLDGFEVLAAENGVTGLKLAREQLPKLILLDWMMPGMDGLKVLSELKNNPKTKHIPVFMLTAKGSMYDLGQALYQGADDYITKPFDPLELSKTVRAKMQKV